MKSDTFFEVRRLFSGLLLAFAPALLAGEFAIRGTVVDKLSHLPVRRALVQVVCEDGPQFFTLTDVSGRFAVANVAGGECQAFAEKPGYVDGSTSEPVKIGPSRDDVVVALTPGATVTGRVVDTAGDPVANAWVKAFQATIVEGRRQLQWRDGAYTNDLGRCRISGLAPGTWYLLATSHIPQTQERMGVGMPNPVSGTSWSPLYYGGSEIVSGATPVKLDAGATFQADFTVSAQPDYSITGKIEGFVPNQRAEVELLRASDNENIASAIYNISSGRFSIGNVPAGSYYLRATTGGETSSMRALEAIEVNGNIRNMALSLLPGVDIKGEIEGVPANGGEGAARCVIGLIAESESPNSGRRANVKPGEEFTFKTVLQGRYRLSARCLPNGWIKSATLGDMDVLRQPFTVGSGTASLKLTLGDKSGEIIGTVHDGSGARADAQVVLVPEDGAAPLIRLAQNGGTFQFQNVPPGKYRAYAWNNAMQPEYASPDYLRNYSDYGRDVTVEADGKATLDLERIEGAK